jgi:hypothetical protein
MRQLLQACCCCLRDLKGYSPRQQLHQLQLLLLLLLVVHLLWPIVPKVTQKVLCWGSPAVAAAAPAAPACYYKPAPVLCLWEVMQQRLALLLMMHVHWW